MDLRLTGEQKQLVDSFGALFAKEASPERVRAAEPSGHDAALWRRLVAMGIVDMALPEEAGGWGASLLDLALVAEQQGRTLAPVPAVDAQVAARLLARVGATPAAGLTTFALHPLRDGRATLVPAGTLADAVVALDGDRLVRATPLSRTPVENLGASPLADLTLDLSTADTIGGLADFERGRDEWMALTAAALVGIAARALEIGVDYVKERRAFGAPIGSFQAISHRLADVAAEVDGARLLAYEAAWADDNDASRFSELAAMAFAFASETARDATYWSLHFHGGYGFMLEYDIQLYYRRARAWARVFADPRTAYSRVADARYGPESIEFG